VVRRPQFQNCLAATLLRGRRCLSDLPWASRRRLLLALSAGALVPGLAFAQRSSRIYRLGVLVSSSAVLKDAHWVAFFRHLGELGLVEGRNLAIELRSAENRPERLPALAAELAKLRCDVFFGASNEAALTALTAASRDTPIVVVAVDFDPLASGKVASLAQPGGRLTGVTAMQSTMPAKRLELLREMLPGASRVTVFTNAQTAEQLSVTQSAAPRLGMALQVVNFKNPPFDYDRGFASATAARADALFVLGSGLWVPARRTIIERALSAHLPSAFHHSGWVEAGGLMSYGFSFPALWRRGAEMVASVLRGANVSEIPMEQPSTFELAINLKTAGALGVAIPRPLLLRADRVFD
jgi:putative ABC transport system substrate-binding protein